MPQLLIATVGTSLTCEARDELRKSIADQMDGCDVRVVLVPPGVCIQHLPQLPFIALQQQPTAPQAQDEPAQVPVSDPGPYNEIGQREVQHVDTNEPEASGIPPHVWLYRNMLTDLQALAPLGRDETNGQYAVAIEDLTDAQRAIPHAAKQLPLPDVFDCLLNPGA